MLGSSHTMKKYPAIDEKWPDHQLKSKEYPLKKGQEERNFAVLRILACPAADKPYDPFLVERFENTQIPLPLKG